MKIVGTKTVSATYPNKLKRKEAVSNFETASFNNILLNKVLPPGEDLGGAFFKHSLKRFHESC